MNEFDVNPFGDELDDILDADTTSQYQAANGQFLCRILEAGIQDTRDGAGKNLNFLTEIVAKPFTGRKMRSWIFFSTTSGDEKKKNAAKRGKTDVKKLFAACGIINPDTATAKEKQALDAGIALPFDNQNGRPEALAGRYFIGKVVTPEAADGERSFAELKAWEMIDPSEYEDTINGATQEEDASDLPI
jgi:hypothetical protein